MECEIEIEETNFSDDSDTEYSNDDGKVHVTLFLSSTLKNTVEGSQMKVPVLRTLITQENCSEPLIEALLECVPDLPSTFLSGHDCDMVYKLSKMLYHATMQCPDGVHIDYLYAFVMVSKDSCHYNIVTYAYFSYFGHLIPSPEMVQRLACESGVYSLPAGASAIETLNAANGREDDCSICMQGFVNGGGVAKLPCSHVYHCHCILEWFVHQGTCPVCRVPYA